MGCVVYRYRRFSPFAKYDHVVADVDPDPGSAITRPAYLGQWQEESWPLKDQNM